MNIEDPDTPNFVDAMKYFLAVKVKKMIALGIWQNPYNWFPGAVTGMMAKEYWDSAKRKHYKTYGFITLAKCNENLCKTIGEGGMRK